MADRVVTPLGNMLMMSDGDYVAGSTHNKNHYVYYEADNTTYISLKDNNAVTPINDHVNWQTLCKGTGGVISGTQENILDNGDFDIWQRGITATNLPQFGCVADRWIDFLEPDGTTVPTTITTSRRTLAVNEIPNCKYCYHVAWNSDLSNIGANFRHMIYQQVDEGVSRYVRAGAKITIKFLAKSNLTGKKIAVNMHERSDNNLLNLNGASFSVGTDWTEITYTWAPQSMGSDTISVNDSLVFQIYFAWGTYYSQRFENVTEPYRGAGYVEIANVRVVYDDAVRNVRKKPFQEELTNCKRYFQKSWDYNSAIGTAEGNGANSILCGDNTTQKTILNHTAFETEMFTKPTVTLYDTNSGVNVIATKDASNQSIFGITPSIGLSNIGTKGFNVGHSGTMAGIIYHWTASCGEDG